MKTATTRTQTYCNHSDTYVCEEALKIKTEHITFSIYHSVRLRQEPLWKTIPGMWSDLSSRQLLWYIQLGGLVDRSAAQGTERWMDLICHKRQIVRQHRMVASSLSVSFVRHFAKLGLLSQLRAVHCFCWCHQSHLWQFCSGHFVSLCKSIKV